MAELKITGAMRKMIRKDGLPSQQALLDDIETLERQLREAAWTPITSETNLRIG